LQKAVASHIDHPLARAMLECKHSEKVAGAYLENFLEYSFEGRVHAKINPLGARTGRMSVSEPALQQLPRDDTVARDAFIPSEGNRLILCDYDQVEARLMVHFGKATALRGLFGGAIDFFTGMARQIYNVPELVKSDPRRSFAKNGVYAKIYGAGAARFASTVGVPLEEGEAFINLLDETYPEIRALQDEVDRVAKQRRELEGGAYVDTPYGRRHKIGDRDGIYKLLNYLIQGTAGDILKRKTVELDAAGVADYLVLPVHDELDFDVPAELVDDVSRMIDAVMPETGFDVPITVGIDVVDRWGDKYRQS
jgi:DNA polymerase-1